jgi:hypothetical protein
MSRRDWQQWLRERREEIQRQTEASIRERLARGIDEFRRLLEQPCEAPFRRARNP